MFKSFISAVVTLCFATQTCFADTKQTSEDLQKAVEFYQKYKTVSELLVASKEMIKPEAYALIQEKMKPIVNNTLPKISVHGTAISIEPKNAGPYEVNYDFDRKVVTVNHTEVQMPVNGDYEAFWSKVQAALPKTHAFNLYNFLIPDANAIFGIDDALFCMVAGIIVIITSIIMLWNLFHDRSAARDACWSLKASDLYNKGPKSAAERAKLKSLIKTLSEFEAKVDHDCNGVKTGTCGEITACLRDVRTRYGSYITQYEHVNGGKPNGAGTASQ